VVLTRIADRRLLRLAALVALASALALAGCGRKGVLEAPPSAAVGTQPPSPDERTSLGQGYDPNTPGYLRAPQQPAVAAASSTAPVPARRNFFLDFLIK
jgi:predicted small lipoprotein YifL